MKNKMTTLLMNDHLYVLVGFILLMVLLAASLTVLVIYLIKREKKNQKTIPANNAVIEIENQEQMKYNCAYKPEYLLSRNEKSQYWLLRSWADKNNLIVFTKVRLADLISPRENGRNRQQLFWKIQAKHVDFVVCDNSIRVKCIIEIMDSSHYDPERIKRDNFVKEVLTSCGYKLIQTHHINHAELDKIIKPAESQY